MDIYELLKSIEGITVVRYYPKKFDKLPIVTFYELSNVDSEYSEDDVYSTEVEYQVDLYCTNSPAIYKDAILKVLKESGYKKEFSADIPEESGLIHYTFRFLKEE